MNELTVERYFNDNSLNITSIEMCLEVTFGSHNSLVFFFFFFRIISRTSLLVSHARCSSPMYWRVPNDVWLSSFVGIWAIILMGYNTDGL